MLLGQPGSNPGHFGFGLFPGNPRFQAAKHRELMVRAIILLRIRQRQWLPQIDRLGKMKTIGHNPGYRVGLLIEGNVLAHDGWVGGETMLP
jgi:hypothetical protein